MSVSTAYKLGKVGIGADIIPAIQSNSVDFGTQEIASGGSGAQQNSLVATMLMQGNPSAQTMDLAIAINALGLTGKKLNPDSYDLYYFEKDQGGTVKAGSQHLKVSITDGMVLPRSISASQGSEALMTMEGIPLSAGVNDPIIIANDVAMPAGAEENPDKWTLGPVFWNRPSPVVFEVTDLNIDFGLQQNVQGANGVPFHTFVSVDKEEPGITFSTLDFAQLALIPQQGLIIEHEMRFYYTKLKQGATRHANNETVHIQFSINAGMIFPSNLSGDTTGTQGFRIVPITDGSNPFFAVDTTSDIVLV